MIFNIMKSWVQCHCLIVQSLSDCQLDFKFHPSNSTARQRRNNVPEKWERVGEKAEEGNRHCPRLNFVTPGSVSWDGSQHLKGLCWVACSPTEQLRSMLGFSCFHSGGTLSPKLAPVTRGLGVCTLVGPLSPLLEPELDLWLTSINKMWREWHCANFWL